mgnify:CR=1 FL=1
MIFSRKKIIAKRLIALLLISLPLFSSPLRGNERSYVRQKLDTIVNQQKYLYQEDDGNKKLPPEADSLLKKINDLLNRFWEFLAAAFRISPYFSLVFYAGILLLVLFLLFRLMRRWKRNRDASLNTADKNALLDIYSLDYEKELKEAERLMSLGSYREAISLILNALWLYFNHRKALQYEKSITNREYLRQLHHWEDYNALREIVQISERSVYFEKEVHESDCRKILASVADLISR